MSNLFEAHQEVLEAAVKACAERGFWSPYPEAPSGRIYGETARKDGEEAFKALLGKPFDLDQPTTGERVGAEVSPYGFELGVGYPKATVDQLIDAAKAAGKSWAVASVEDRVGVCLEVLNRLNKRSFEMANAVMHTSGQAFMMAFQAGGPHAQDRGLEAVAYAYQEMKRVPGAVLWEKPQGKHEPIRLDKTFRIVPRGVAVAIGCSTFPNWNSYPGMFASLATGNAVIVKPHPGAILPLALTVKICREVLAEQGFDANTVLLAADGADAPITKDLVTHPAVGIIDYTGGPAFGEWLEANAHGAQVYTEQAGVNSIVVDGTDNFKGMCQNVSFSLSLYSGQMCTAPQNVYVPRAGIETDQGHKSYDEVADGIATAMTKLLGDPDRAAGVLGAIQNEATLARVREVEAEAGDNVVVASKTIEIPGFEGARACTPVMVKADAADEGAYLRERFGPISYIIATDGTEDSITRAADSAKTKGAITAAIYATDEKVLDQAADAFAEAGAALSCNLTGGVFVNQSAAFSDFHVSGANPAGNASLSDAAFVANRFRVVAVRRPHAA